MRNKFTLYFLLLISSLHSYSATITAAVPGGEWTDTGSWVGGVVPVNGDVVIIPNGSTITITGQVVTYTGTLAITIESGGVLELNATSCGFFCVDDAELNLGAGSLITIDAGGTVQSTAFGGAFAEIVINGVTAWDPFVLFGSSDPNPANGPATISESGFLPVELISFETIASEEAVKLNWATSFETNFSHFEVERSVDGETFTTIGGVDGVGESISIVNYSFTDENPYLGLNYYRLRAVDLDESYELFGPLEVEYIGETAMRVYPNPANDGYLHVDLNFEPDRPLRLMILDSSGRAVIDSETTGSNNRVTLPGGIGKGLYLVQVTDGTRRLTQKFVVSQ